MRRALRAGAPPGLIPPHAGAVLFPTLALWSALVVIFTLVAVFTLHDAHGRAFVATALTFAVFLAGMLLFAARNLPDRIAAIAGPASGWLLAVILFFIFLVYALGTGTASFARLGATAAFIFLPLALLSTAQTAAPGSWQDLFILVAIWATVKFGPACPTSSIARLTSPRSAEAC